MTPITFTLKTLINEVNPIIKNQNYLDKALDTTLTFEQFNTLKTLINQVDVSDTFKDVIDTFQISYNHTPAGFEVLFQYAGGGLLLVDVKRNIAYGSNGIKRPTNLLFSADSANPYEIEPIKDMIAKLTCNPGIIYDLFINNPKANVGNKFKTRDEVISTIGQILGPGVDISVELDDPFRKSDQEILEEVAHFEKMLTKYRLVVKVPHTGPVNAENVQQLLEGDKKLDTRFNQASTMDAFRGHRIATMLKQHGYRVNFTLMFEPHQTNLALQAQPAYINAFIRHRLKETQKLKELVDAFFESEDESMINKLIEFMIEKDYLLPKDVNISADDVLNKAMEIIEYREINTPEGFDGLDSVRHNLRLLRNCNMEDTRLIVCSMEGDLNYMQLDKMLAEAEFVDMQHKVVITAEPNYLARFTSTNQVVAYQRRFMNAANNQK